MVDEETRRYRPTKNYLEHLPPLNTTLFEVSGISYSSKLQDLCWAKSSSSCLSDSRGRFLVITDSYFAIADRHDEKWMGAHAAATTYGCTQYETVRAPSSPCWKNDRHSSMDRMCWEFPGSIRTSGYTVICKIFGSVIVFNMAYCQLLYFVASYNYIVNYCCSIANLELMLDYGCEAWKSYLELLVASVSQAQKNLMALR